jgi:tetratricopeptide (TPR) repeat protein
LEEIEDVRRTAISLNNIGRAHRNMGENREAIKFHERSFGISSEIGGQADQIVALNNIGFAHLNLKACSLAAKNCHEAYNKAKEIGEKMVWRKEDSHLWMILLSGFILYCSYFPYLTQVV